MLRSEFFQLSPTEPYKGFESLFESMSANQDDEEVWLELEFYRNRKDRDQVMAKIGKDSTAHRLLGQVMGLFTPGAVNLQSEFNR